VCPKHSGKRKIPPMFEIFTLFFWRDASIISYVLLFMPEDNEYVSRNVGFTAATNSDTESCHVQCDPGVLVRREMVVELMV